MKDTKKPTIALWLVVTLIMSLLIVLNTHAAPEGPNITVMGTETRTPLPATTLSAVAGNVTEISIYATTVTQSWQGYFGNISGKLTLDDASNNTLYNWTVANPEGEIYASPSAIDFSEGNIFCYNYSEVFPADLSLEELEASYNITSDDDDGINETFSYSQTHAGFYAGINQISANTCPAVHLFNETGETSDFQELLLYDNTSKSVIFTSIINTDKPGFTGVTNDFQLIVAEDGHSGDTTPTTYYFYVEIE